MPSVSQEVTATSPSKKNVLRELGNVSTEMSTGKVAPVPVLYFVKLSDKAHQPTKGSKLAAGYDLKRYE
jgi:hypothetical protein